MTLICRLGALAVAATVLVSSMPVRAQDDARRLWDSEFLSKRAPSKSKPRPRKEPAYRVATPTPPPPAAVASGSAAAASPAPAAVAGELVGVTVWRLRRSQASDSGDSRLLVQETENQRAESVEWTPERVEAETPFAAGDRVRLSIESPRAGYLYVVDRELYADGTTSDPYLIFPTQRMRDGDNTVRPGKVIELPDKSAFKLTPLRDDYRGERLTILVTSEPLSQVTVPADAQRLEPSLVAQWETQWAAAAERLELVGGAGQAYTGIEKDAAAQGRLLTQDDALPQTLYRVLSAPGSPVMISVPLKIAK
jgi:cell division septation protein DedD